VFWFLGALAFVWLFIYSAAHAEPLASHPYRHTLTREAHAQWGLRAPIATMAGQIEQESGWRRDVCSSVACGLTQFTTPTAKWLGAKYPALLGVVNVFDPGWSLRALVIFDRDLYQQNAGAANDYNRWAFLLSSYNGGIGNLRRDQNLCREECNPTLWFGNVELRSGRSTAAFRENRNYVRAILERRQFTYEAWGDTVTCQLC
jgi:membrane-bound lytic murein transglycosylase MltF